MSLLDTLSHDLMIPETRLVRIINSAPHRYKVYQVDKKSGVGKRTIAQPAREVKALQYWVMENVLAALPIHSSAQAYRAGRSIYGNATLHVRQRYLMKLDFKDFFTSVTAQDLEAYFEGNTNPRLRPQDVMYLGRILFWNRERAGRLVMSIGAPSSPMLSNILMFRFDELVSELCRPLDVIYSRYADDLSFSTDRRDILREVKFRVEQICQDMRHPRVVLNERKTVHASRAKLRTVTGLVLSNDGLVSLGRERKRIIRAQVHRFLHGGMESDETAHLQGMLAFVNAVEPEFLEKLRAHYGHEAIAQILRPAE